MITSFTLHDMDGSRARTIPAVSIRHWVIQYRDLLRACASRSALKEPHVCGAWVRAMGAD